MAKNGHSVYCFYDHDHELAKFGVSGRPMLRFDTIKQQTKSTKLEFVGLVEALQRNTALELEKVFFESFANARRKHPVSVTHAEWFAVSLKDAKFALKIAQNLINALAEHPHNMYGIIAHQRLVAKQVAQRLGHG